MKRKLIVVLSLIALLSGCEEEKPDKYSLEDYKISENPLENIDYCFTKAKAILGDSVFLYLIKGKRVDDNPGIEYHLNWYWYFYEDSKRTILEFDTKKRVITEMNDIPLGLVCIRETDNRLYSILPPKQVWNKDIDTYETPLLSISLFIPLIPDPVGFEYVLVSSCGYRIYNAETGEEIIQKIYR